MKPPYEIVEKYEGKCPNCGKKLSHIPKNFEVKPVDETKLSPSEKKRSSSRKSRVKIRERRKRAWVKLIP